MKAPLAPARLGGKDQFYLKIRHFFCFSELIKIVVLNGYMRNVESKTTILMLNLLKFIRDIILFLELFLFISK